MPGPVDQGGIRAGIDLLLKGAGTTPHRLDRVLIAGLFGYHLSEESLLSRLWHTGNQRYVSVKKWIGVFYG